MYSRKLLYNCFEKRAFLLTAGNPPGSSSLARDQHALSTLGRRSRLWHGAMKLMDSGTSPVTVAL